MDDLIKIVGNNIRYYRKRKKLSLEKLAELSGLNAKYLGSVERSESNISVEKLANLTKALEIPPYQLFLSSPEQLKLKGESLELSPEDRELLTLFKRINRNSRKLVKDILKAFIKDSE